MSDFNRKISSLFLINYILMIVNVGSLLGLTTIESVTGFIFSAFVILSYAMIYLLPAGIIVSISQLINKLARNKKFSRTIVYITAVTALSLTHLFLVVDHSIFKMYGFHLNGFVWNLIKTKGGLDSLGADTSSIIAFLSLVLAIISVQIFTLYMTKFALKKKGAEKDTENIKKNKLSMKLVYCIVIISFGIQAIIYGVSSFKGFTPVLSKATLFPVYQPVTFQGFLKKIGLKPTRTNSVSMDTSDSKSLNYPLSPLERTPNAKKYNIVWMVAESLRADMLNEEIMPASYNFAKKACNFKNHYSGGNGTRMGMFSMFYGLYGNYWFSFLNEQRSPVLIDTLINDGYQFELFDSAMFSYPEFDKTIFSRIPTRNLHDGLSGEGWERDRKHINSLTNFINNRDTNKPFMTFMFFESPHARYYFPKESIIRKNYLEDFNYTTANIERDINLIKNRYINSCRHLDSQIERVLNCLKENSLMNSTIVIIVGDHGEEFMEKGRWGHNSEFTEEQTKTPLVIYLPGIDPFETESLSSHLDIPATILTHLGITNPPSDYSLGYDLLGKTKRQKCVLANWNGILYLDKDCKISIPLRNSFTTQNKITSLDDKLIENSNDIFNQKTDQLMNVMKESSLFKSH